MPLNRVRVALTGFTGLPGVATFHFNSSVTDMTALRTFWDSVKSVFPNSVLINVPNAGDTITENSGVIQGAWSGPAQATVQGTGGTTSVVSTGGPMVRWTTPQVVDGRRPIGKTFLTPMVAIHLTTTGTVASSVATTVSNAAQALVVAYAGEMKTYHRPKGGTGGVGCTIIAGTCSNKLMVLRSRRD